jgi:hypothetical protein
LCTTRPYFGPPALYFDLDRATHVEGPYLVSTDDRMIPQPAQRAMAERAGATAAEAAGSHSIYVSQPSPSPT